MPRWAQRPASDSICWSCRCRSWRFAWPCRCSAAGHAGQRLAALAAGALLGLAPLIAHNLPRGWPLLDTLRARLAEESASTALHEVVLALLQRDLPALLSLRNFDCFAGGVPPGVRLQVLLLLLAVAALVWLRRRRLAQLPALVLPPRRRLSPAATRDLLALGTLLAVVIAYCVIPVKAPRYLLPMLPALLLAPAALLPVVLRWARGRGARQCIALLALVALLLPGALAHLRVAAEPASVEEPLPPAPGRPFSECVSVPEADLLATLAQLRADGIRHGYAPFHLKFRLNYLGDGDVLLSGAGLWPFGYRLPEFEDAVESVLQPGSDTPYAFVLYVTGARQRNLEAGLRERDIGYRTTRHGAVMVTDRLQRLVKPRPDGGGFVLLE